jgi:LmbE family N-acetylglucosaminyl deacetylase
MIKNIIISPHLDDAVIDCWHLVANPDSILVNVFSGIPAQGTHAWWDRLCGEPDSHKMVQMRLKENAMAVSISGNANPQQFLGFLDNQYRRADNVPLVSDLANLIDKSTPKTATIFAPLALSRIYRHPDHVLGRLTALELYKRNYRVRFYPDQPYMSLPSKPREPKIKRTQDLAKKVLGLSLVAQVVPLSEDQLMLKHEAMKAYRSQYTLLNVPTLGAMDRISKRPYELIFTPAGEQ